MPTIGAAVIGSSYHHPRLPMEWRHQLVDAGSGRERVRWAGQVHECHRSRGARRTALCHLEGERGVRCRAGSRPAARRGRARSGHCCERHVPGRSRQEQRGRAPSPGPKPPGPGAAAMAAAEGGKRAGEGGGRAGRREAGEPASRRRGSPAPAPQPHQLHVETQGVSESRSGKPAVTGGLTVPSSGEEEEGGGRVAGGVGHAQGEHEEDHRSRRAPRRNCWSLHDPARHPTRRARRGGQGPEGRSPEGMSIG